MQRHSRPLVAVLLLILIPLFASATPTEEWNDFQDPQFNDDYYYNWATEATTDIFGNVYTLGYVVDGWASYLVKLSNSGSVQWTYNTNTSLEIIYQQHNEEYDVAVDADENVYMTGAVIGSCQGPNCANLSLIKLNSGGSLQWELNSDISANGDLGYAIDVDGSGNVYVAGETGRLSNGEGDWYVAKYDTNGTRLWYNISDPTEIEGVGGASAIAADDSGNVFVAGGTNPRGAGTSYMYVVKYDTNGIFQWDYTSEASDYYDYITKIDLDAAGNVYLLGPNNAGVPTIFKMNSTGALQWNSTINVDFASDLAVDAGGNSYVAAGYFDNSAYVILKYDENGTYRWNHTLERPDEFYYYGGPNGIAIDKSTGIFLAGACYGNDCPTNDPLGGVAIYTVKLKEQNVTGIGNCSLVTGSPNAQCEPGMTLIGGGCDSSMDGCYPSAVDTWRSSGSQLGDGTAYAVCCEDVGDLNMSTQRIVIGSVAGSTVTVSCASNEIATGSGAYCSAGGSVKCVPSQRSATCTASQYCANLEARVICFDEPANTTTFTWATGSGSAVCPAGKQLLAGGWGCFPGSAGYAFPDRDTFYDSCGGTTYALCGYYQSSTPQSVPEFSIVMLILAMSISAIGLFGFSKRIFSYGG